MKINGIEGDRETVEILRAICIAAIGGLSGEGGLMLGDRLRWLGDSEKADLAKVEQTMRDILLKTNEREAGRKAEKEALRRKSADMGEGSAGLGVALGLEGRTKSGRWDWRKGFAWKDDWRRSTSWLENKEKADLGKVDQTMGEEDPERENETEEPRKRSMGEGSAELGDGSGGLGAALGLEGRKPLGRPRRPYAGGGGGGASHNE